MYICICLFEIMDIGLRVKAKFMKGQEKEKNNETGRDGGLALRQDE